MSSHTQGKLIANNDGYLVDQDERCVAAIGSWGDVAGPEKMIADTRRLAACWNACAGFDTELLENIDMMGDTLKQRFDGMRSETQRMDAMLAKRSCQNDRCNELTTVRALLSEVIATHEAAEGYDLKGIFVEEFAERIRAALAP